MSRLVIVDLDDLGGEAEYYAELMGTSFDWDRVFTKEEVVTIMDELLATILLNKDICPRGTYTEQNKTLEWVEDIIQQKISELGG